MIPFDDTKNIIKLLVVVIGGFILSVTLIELFRESDEIDSQPDLRDYFNSTQIVELKQLTEFVVNQLTANCESDQNSCLLEYLNQYIESGYDVEITGISRAEQSNMLNSLSEETYNEIWGTCRGTRSFSQDSVVNIESICPNMKGNFATFLTKYCAQFKRLSNYGEAFELAGDYSPAMTGQLLKNPTSFNLESKEELLLIAIHLLTLNNEDQIMKKVPNI